MEKELLSKKDLLKLKVSIPTLEEQNEIAEILNTANQEVKQYQQKLETLKLQKKGLMQQLLTGKVRTV
jgi:type I restriction enzyme S subunit